MSHALDARALKIERAWRAEEADRRTSDLVISQEQPSRLANYKKPARERMVAALKLLALWRGQGLKPSVCWTHPICVNDYNARTLPVPSCILLEVLSLLTLPDGPVTAPPYRAGGGAS